MKMLPIGLLLPFGLAIAIGSTETPPIPDEIVLADASFISGQIEADVVRVEADSTIYVEADTIIKGREHVLIEGKIQLADIAPESEGPGDAPDLEILCDRRLTILGDIYGGRGRSFHNAALDDSKGRPGGEGSDITISAPDIFLSAYVVAGRGGAGGIGADGGNAGGITMRGVTLSDHGLTPEQLKTFEFPGALLGSGGGKGGEGYIPAKPGEGHLEPGSPGHSGFVEWQPHPDSAALADEYAAAASQSSGSFAISGPGSPCGDDDCPDGIDGRPGPESVGSPGIDGSDGPDGYAGHPDGFDGTDGSDGTVVRGPAGAPGSDGADCCNPEFDEPGGNGGKGGNGGDAKARSGGTGGNGGRAYQDGGEWQGKGGDAGNGGDGGEANAGSGGAAGNGGDGCEGYGGGAAGIGGDPGTPTPGTGGDAGEPGLGIEPGADGMAGRGGSANAGSYGASGTPGGICSSGCDE